MKEEKIREKYPNIKTEEEFKKLCKMLKYKKYEKVATFCTGLLIILWIILYRLNLKISITYAVAVVVVWGISTACCEKYIDEFFLATVSRKKVANRTVLNQETVQKALKKDIVGELGSDFVASVFISILCMIVWTIFLSEDDTKFPVLVFFVMILLLAFGILRISAITKRRKTKSTPILLHTKIVDRKCISSLDPEYGSDSYYFTFNCADYGVLDYKVSNNSYHAAFIGKDAYYLVVEKRRFSEEYKIVKIFSAEEYELSPEFERIVVVI